MTTPDIKSLALAAVEARKNYLIGQGKPDTEDRLWNDYVKAREKWNSAATPERILQYRDEVLEEAAERVLFFSGDGAYADARDTALCNHLAHAIRALQTPEESA